MKRIHLFLVGILFLLCLVPLSQACSDDSPEIPVPPTPENPDPPTATWKNITAAPDNWDGTKRADISYQLLVYSFADKDGDKYGDLNGLIDKLDYINSLGVTALWLSPIHPAMSYHGYDVTDHTKVNPKLGTEAGYGDVVGMCDIIEYLYATGYSIAFYRGNERTGSSLFGRRLWT